MAMGLTKRRVLVVALILLVPTAAVFVARITLTEKVVTVLLQKAGATEIKFRVAEVSPWSAVIDDLDFRIKAGEWSAKHLVLSHEHWWALVLSEVQLEQVHVPLSALAPIVPAADANGQLPEIVVSARAKLSFGHADGTGEIVLGTPGAPEQIVKIIFSAQQQSLDQWTGTVRAEAPGLQAAADGTSDLLKRHAAFRLSQAVLDLKSWQPVLARFGVIPAPGWDFGGELTAHASGAWQESKVTGMATAHLGRAHAAWAEKNISLEGIEADLGALDLASWQSQPGTIKVHEIHTGKLAVQDLAATFALAGRQKLAIAHFSVQALGGTVNTEPFDYFPAAHALDLVVNLEGISIGELMALTQDLPAKASGQVNGRFPLRVDGAGLHLGTGWLALKPGVTAEVQLSAAGLLTNGVAKKSASYAVLERIESGLLNLNLTELRLDIYPPDAPAGRSAQLHIAGEPTDTTVKAPVILDLNVNGPLEKLIDLGIDSRVSFTH